MKFQVIPRRFRAAASLMLVGALVSTAHAQTATSNATNNLSCTSDRSGVTYNCTAKEFTVGVTLASDANTPPTCVAGQSTIVSGRVSLSGTNTNRWTGAFYFGQTGNDPGVVGGGQCSVATFPLAATSPTATPGFTNFNGDGVGDYISGGTEDWQIDNIKVTCTAGANGTLTVPYLLSYSQNSGALPSNNDGVTSTLLVPGSPSKCQGGSGSLLTVPGTAVQGYIKITKATSPAGASDAFTFNTTTGTFNTRNAGPPVTFTPSTNTLTDGQSKYVLVTLGAAPVNVTITEQLASGWSSTAAITCTAATGSGNPVTATNNASRSITATLTTANFGAECTITNTALPKLTLVKTVDNTTGGTNVATDWTLAAAGTTPISGTTGAAAITSAPVQPGTYTLSESSAVAGTSNYTASSYSCVKNGGAAVSGNSIILALTDTATCTITNTFTKNADLKITKTHTPSPLVSGGTANYTLTVTNAGPATVTGAVVTDTPVSGITCPAANPVTITGSGVPAGSYTVASLTGAGITLGTLTAGQSTTFTFTCNVN